MSDSPYDIPALLDQGIVVYRRNFAQFVLLAATGVVPLSVGAPLTTLAVLDAQDRQAAVLRGGLACRRQTSHLQWPANRLPR
jgi:hypothetical protein